MFKSKTVRKNARIKDYISVSDLKRLNNADIVPWKMRLICNILFFSALRIGELHPIKPNHIIKQREDDKDHYFIHLETQKSGVEDEYTPLRLEEYTSIKDYIEANGIKPNDYIFGSSKFRFQKQMTTSWFNTELQKYAKILEIDKDLSSHSFRKGRITQMRKDKVPYDEIATVTRHQNIHVLQKHYDKQIKFGASDLVNRPVG